MKWIVIIGLVALVAIGFLFFRLPQPIIELRPEPVIYTNLLDINNTWLTAWLMIAIIGSVTFLGTRKLAIVPRGFQNLFEAVVEGFFNLVSSVAGEKNGRRFFPVVFSLFLYIVLCNWAALTPLFNVIGTIYNVNEDLDHYAEDYPDEEYKYSEIRGWVMSSTSFGTVVPLFEDVDYIRVDLPEGTTNTEARVLLDEAFTETLGRPLADDEVYGFIAPWFRGVNTDLNAPLAYALWSAFFVEFWGITALGLFAYGSKFFNFKRLFQGDIVNGIIDVFVGFLEFISELSRLISFTFRLFGNIFAGEVLLFIMSFLVPFLLINVFYGLELFVGLIQAFVFAMLTLVFGVMAVTSHGDHEQHQADHRSGGEHGSAHA